MPKDDRVAYGEEWAVITDPYASFRNTTDFSAKITAHARRGDVLILESREIVAGGNGNTVWYRFEQGWLPAESVAVYPNRLKAENAAAQFN